MIETLLALNWWLGVFGIIAMIITAALIADLSTKRILTSFLQKWGYVSTFFVVSISSILTLVYSEYFGIVPCGLCWLERIALYPQILMLGIAFYYKDTMMTRYGIALSIFGLIVALYHHYIQTGGSEFIKCPAAGADCTKRFLFEFNFMTFPLLAAILFAFLIAVYYYMLKTRG